MDNVLMRIDSTHSNITVHWHAEDGWPTAEQWDRLHAIDKLDEQTLPDVIPTDGNVQLELDLPLPGVLLLHLIPM